MRKIFLAFMMFVTMFGAVGCSTPPGHKLAEAHKGVFGCWPEGYTPPRVLEAEGPKEDTCGRPIYKRPECAECPDCNVK